MGVNAARVKGHRVLACQAVEAEAHLAFAAVGDLLDPVLTDTLPRLPGPQRRALEAALLRVDADELADERAVTFGLLSVLRAVAGTGPVLIAVDDWQWLDTASARVLRFLLRRLGDEPIRVLVTARTGAAAGLARDMGRSGSSGSRSNRSTSWHCTNFCGPGSGSRCHGPLC